MGKWRPAQECIYVIPDIHGQLTELQLILDRILPLRNSDGVKDTIIFLGDYIDRGYDSPLVLDKLIELKKQYEDQIVFLIGNHEMMFLEAMIPFPNKHLFWMNNGGDITLSAYLDRANYHLDNPYELPRSRIADYIPKEHIEFIMSLKHYHETDDFIFAHAGLDPFTPLEEQDKAVFYWDRSLYNNIKNVFRNVYAGKTWEKCIITGHNCSTSQKKPFITEKFMMLDCSCHNKLIVLELNSMECFEAKKGKKRLVRVVF